MKHDCFSLSKLIVFLRHLLCIQLKEIKNWATRRWQENVVQVATFEDLEKPDVVTRIVANICPKEEPKMSFEFVKEVICWRIPVGPDF